MTKRLAILTFFTFISTSQASSLVCFTAEEKKQEASAHIIAQATVLHDGLRTSFPTQNQILIMNASLPKKSPWKLCFASSTPLFHTDINDILRVEEVRKALSNKEVDHISLQNNNTDITLNWSDSLQPTTQSLDPLVSIHPFGKIKHAVWSYSRASNHIDSVLTCTMNDGRNISHNFHQSDLPDYATAPETGILSIRAQNLSLEQLLRTIQHPGVLNRRYQRQRFSITQIASPLITGSFIWMNTRSPSSVEDLNFKIDVDLKLPLS
ncbi:MAG: hypothetical protein AB8C84_06445 [Oligoflexales bacterium]